MIDSWLLEAEAGAGAAISAAQTSAPAVAANILARRALISGVNAGARAKLRTRSARRSLSGP